MEGLSSDPGWRLIWSMRLGSGDQASIWVHLIRRALTIEIRGALGSWNQQSFRFVRSL